MHLTKGRVFTLIGIAGLGLWYIYESSKWGPGFFGPFPLILPAIVVIIVGSFIDKPKFVAIASRSRVSRTLEIVGLFLFAGLVGLVIWSIFKGYG